MLPGVVAVAPPLGVAGGVTLSMTLTRRVVGVTFKALAGPPVLTAATGAGLGGDDAALCSCGDVEE
jgi:hypothetical protein